MKKRPSMIMILDGYGYLESDYGNAVAQARTPVLDALIDSNPHTLIGASGLAVGLPDGQMGNSEVGHLNIGAGRIVYQSLTRIDRAIEDGSLFGNKTLLEAIDRIRDGGKLHFMGLVSPGGVHSHSNHLYALLELAKREGVSGKVYIHAILDGRDTPPQSAEGYIADLEKVVADKGVGTIATVSGRYYAMDRDNRWDREEKAYDALILGEGLKAKTAGEAVAASYGRGENDEFVQPTVIVDADDRPIAVINDGDSVIFYNFRPDRAREITRAITELDFEKGLDEGLAFSRKAVRKNIFFVTMTEYDESFHHVHVAFAPERIKNTLGEYLSSLGLSQLRIAETEKYAHVTFFFNGGEEPPNPGEDRILVPSPKVATYDLQPEMSAFEVAKDAAENISSGKYDVVILNFANTDMVGHTGKLDAAIKAVEAVDTCVGTVTDAIAKVGGQLLLTADHGNAEKMLTEDGEPVTSHTTNLVRLLLIRDDSGGFGLADGGALCDIAPTLLDMMDLPIPAEMTGRSLLIRKHS
ncbi:MAG: 2,3-bisphosphoglycerate-independent phosphoglycerate mutase [Clostridiales Family XIII bacterium]|nr:2,3-bisphosphoglycerate-independent phosphoglycerate mutase [Clostridiales Family XIII bacterium]